MNRNPAFIVSALFIFTLLLSSCKAFSRQPAQTQSPGISTGAIPSVVSPISSTSSAHIIPPSSPTPIPPTPTSTPTSTPTPVPSLCENVYFPSKIGDRWEYSGNTSVTGAYTRTDTVTASSDTAFTVESTLSDISYLVEYSCNDAGLAALNPIQQYLGALLAYPDSPVKVTLTSTSGISLPAKINPADSWQQIADWEGSVNDYSTNGSLVMDYSANGYENITVPFGTFNALRVDATFQIKVTALKVPAGSYSITFWLTPNIGLIKSEGTSHIPGFDFTDSLELTSFISSR